MMQPSYLQLGSREEMFAARASLDALFELQAANVSEADRDAALDVLEEAHDRLRFRFACQ